MSALVSPGTAVCLRNPRPLADANIFKAAQAGPRNFHDESRHL
ncbi:MAG: hypothetical protein V3S64_03515 [bacterium]